MQTWGRLAHAQTGAPLPWWKARAQAHAHVLEPDTNRPGVLKIDDIEIQYAVLEDGTRMLIQRGFSVALGRYKNPNRGRNPIVNRPAFLAAKNLEPFISEELLRSCELMPFISKAGGVTREGAKGDGLDSSCCLPKTSSWLRTR